MKKILTPLELQVMNLMWKKEKVFIKDLIEHWPKEEEGKKPAYNTISTIVRILEGKDFVGHKAYGRTHEYFPKMTKAAYQRFFIQNAIDKVFSGSVTSLVSALVDDEKVSKDELDDLKKMLE
jgi:predicted transcriptional regulator